MKKKILIDIPCPVSMRNIVTGPRSVYRRLIDAGYDVVLFTPPHAAEVIREAYGAKVESVPLALPQTALQSASDFITKHLNLTRMQVLGSKYGLRHNLAKSTRHAYLHFVRVLIAHTLGKWQWFRVSVAPRMHLRAYRARPFKEAFERIAPDIIFVPNMAGRQGEETLREAKRQGLRTIGMVGSWDHPHKRFQALQTDQVFVWSEPLKKEMIELQSYREENVLVVGAPHFDHYRDPDFLIPREEFFAQYGLDPTKKIFTLFSGTGRAPDEGDIVDMLVRASAEGRTKEPIQVFVRTYPGDEKGDHAKFDAFEGERSVVVDWLQGGKQFGPIPVNYFPDVAYMKNVVSLVYYSEAIVSVYSSASVEASLFLKPSINIGFDGYKERPFAESVKRFIYQSHFDKLFATGAVLDTHSEEDLIAAVNRVLTDPSSNRNEVMKLQETVCGKVDGRASERIAMHIASVVR